MTPSWAIPVGMPASRSTAARVRVGTICLSNSNHFPLIEYSNAMKPVTLPPGRARLFRNPAPTGSATTANTIGTVRVACSRGPTVEAPGPKMTSGASAANSAAFLRTASALAVAQRMSIRTF